MLAFYSSSIICIANLVCKAIGNYDAGYGPFEWKRKIHSLRAVVFYVQHVEVAFST